MMKKFWSYLDSHIYEIAFVLTALATLGSMILSNVLTLAPCTLCWYQRIFMFPLPAIFFVAILRRDNYAYLYAWPIALVGWVISLYQTLLQWGVIKEAVSTCSLTGPSCSEPEINIFGFLTIPFGSFLFFSAANLLMWRAYRLHHSKSAITQKDARLAMNLLVAVALLAVLAVAVIKLFDIQIV